MAQRNLFNLDITWTAGLLSAVTMRRAAMLLMTLLLTMTAQTARAAEGDTFIVDCNGNYVLNDGSPLGKKIPGLSENIIDPNDDTWDGDGTEENPYVIKTPAALDRLATEVNGGMSFGPDNDHPNGYFFELGADIVYTYDDDWDDTNSDENNYTAIGTCLNLSDEKPFSGTFDGKGHTISGIRIYKIDYYNDGPQGLFGYVDGGTVKNVTLADARITGNSFVGGIVGVTAANEKDCLIENCHVLGSVALHVMGDWPGSVGGIAGRILVSLAWVITSTSVSTVSHCTSAALLTIEDDVVRSSCYGFGGIVGFSSHGILSNNLALGCTIPGDVFNAGAIVGINDNGTSIIKNNYYSKCTMGTTTTDIGCGGTEYCINDLTDIITNDGAVLATILSETQVSLPAMNEGDKVVFRREFKGGKASTVVFPFDYTTNASEGTYYTFSGITKEGGQFVATMNENAAATLSANTPYLFVPAGTDAHKPVLFHGTAPATIGAGETESGDWKFYGTYSRLEYGTAPFEGNVYGFASTPENNVQAGEFVKADTGAGVPPFRCYLKYKDGQQYTGARGVTRGESEKVPETIIVRLIGKNGDINGIGTLTLSTGEFSTDGWYSLDGRRLDGKPTKKGLYINNGRKVVIK